MKHMSSRPGTTLVELLLFLAFFALSSGVLISFFFMTSEQRVRQQTIATVEQTGVQLLQTLTNRIRSSERILDPARGASGSLLALQLVDEALHPTVMTLSGSLLYAAEANTLKTLSSDDVIITDFVVRNTSSADDKPSVLVRFDVSRSVPLSIPLTYTRRFEVLVQLYPDDEPNPPCSCDAPSCTSGSYDWQYCVDSVCTDATVTVPCL